MNDFALQLSKDFSEGRIFTEKNPLLAVLNFLEAWRRQKSWSGTFILFYSIAEIYARVYKVASVCTYTGQSKFPYLFSKRCIARSRKTGYHAPSNSYFFPLP